MERKLGELVDVMRVPVSGDAGIAVVNVAILPLPCDIECEVLVVGGGTGGVSAALAAARRGRRVCLIEETDWLGGQLTTQGVSALDEHDYIESFGGTASYYALRDNLRAHYRSLTGAVGQTGAFNPGRCWVTRLAFEPNIAAQHIMELLEPHIASGRLRVFLRTKSVAVTEENDTIRSVLTLNLDNGSTLRFHPGVVIEATELGDLLPLAGAEYSVGAESAAQTGEAHAQPCDAKPRCVQSFTYTFAVERRPDGERHGIRQPEKYAHYRATQPYSLTIEVRGGEIYGEESGRLEYKLYDRMPGTKGGLWTYRRLLAAELFDARVPYDLTMMNWPGNDYRDQSIIDHPAAQVAAALQSAKRVSLGFLYWLQTEAPACGARLGAPELKLRPDAMGSTDGLSKHPYIRESRRILAVKTVVEQEISANFQIGPRAAHFADSIGIGWYPIDIHCAGAEDVSLSCRTKPFQIPLGALLPIRVVNLIAACKNIGTTHVTNGCYRLHPVEWNIGEAAGALAAFALQERMPVKSIRENRLAQFQRSLLDEGIPIAWVIDVGVKHKAFAAVQRLCMARKLDADLCFLPDKALTESEWHAWGGSGAPPPTRAEGAELLASSGNLR